ncbi:MAG: phosphotransferase family protein [Acidimicrobiia bacterium]|nr:phosphotransferase family protein [Acidimicrobiia bacterium]
MGDTAGPPQITDMQRSSRDPQQLRERLEHWFAQLLPEGASPSVPALDTAASANGMSSETVLFTAAWSDNSAHRTERLVARVAPDPADVPVFPEYDLQRQFDVIRLVGELTSVPVPRVWWCDATGAATGVPLFVMERVEGVVPPDVMPYTFGDNWLFDATSEQQRTLQDSSIEVLAQLHAVEDAADRFAFLAHDVPGDTALRRRVNHTKVWYEYARDGHRSSLVERGLAWLEDHWPAHEGPTVVVWGDSRIGNVMYCDFRPCAVLDWEMASLGPRELDLAWMTYAHAVFEDLARVFELPGMPDFLRPEDVTARYESLAGYAPRDLEFYTAYAAVQWGIVFVRTGLRAVHFGEEQMPASVDEFIRNADSLERMLAGTYWS